MNTLPLPAFEVFGAGENVFLTHVLVKVLLGSLSSAMAMAMIVVV